MYGRKKIGEFLGFISYTRQLRWIRESQVRILHMSEKLELQY